MSTAYSLRTSWRTALGVGAIAGLACALGAWRDPTAFFRAYLVAFLYWSALPLGCLAILMMHNLTGGKWGGWLRAPLEVATGTMNLVPLLFLPLLFGLSQLYPWTHADFVAAHPNVQAKAAYLNLPFFLVRAALYLFIWYALASALRFWSLRHDIGQNEAAVARAVRVSAFGLVLYALSTSFAAIDWGMSLEPEWYSTAYPLLFGLGQILAALAFLALVALPLARWGLWPEVMPARLIDFGSVLLGFVLLWAYVAFSQYLVIYSADLPGEIMWYRHRGGGWTAVVLLIIAFHFAAPFLFLLFRATKRNLLLLATIAALLFLMRAIDTFWTIAPAFHPALLAIHWLDVAAWLAVGGVWLAYFLFRFSARLQLRALTNP